MLHFYYRLFPIKIQPFFSQKTEILFNQFAIYNKVIYYAILKNFQKSSKKGLKRFRFYPIILEKTQIGGNEKWQN